MLLMTQHSIDDFMKMVVMPLKQLSSSGPLNREEYQREEALVAAAAGYCRDSDALAFIALNNSELQNFYQDINSFESWLTHEKCVSGADILELSKVWKDMFQETQNELGEKLVSFETQVLKRDSNYDVLNDVKLIRLTISGISRFISDVRSLLIQVYTVDVKDSASCTCRII